eukprot:COSAG06_NODE_4456_length_4243_cov_3.173263_5_plen_32_part_00
MDTSCELRSEQVVAEEVKKCSELPVGYVQPQ